MTKKNSLEEKIIDAITDIKGEQIAIIDFSKVQNAFCSKFIICQGNSNTQVNAIADSIEKKIFVNLNQTPYSIEGRDNSFWVIVDYIDIVVHIFLPKYREFYGVEELWANIPTKTIEY